MTCIRIVDPKEEFDRFERKMRPPDAIYYDKDVFDGLCGVRVENAPMPVPLLDLYQSLLASTRRELFWNIAQSVFWMVAHPIHYIKFQIEKRRRNDIADGSKADRMNMIWRLYEYKDMIRHSRMSLWELHMRYGSEFCSFGPSSFSEPVGIVSDEYSAFLNDFGAMRVLGHWICGTDGPESAKDLTEWLRSVSGLPKGYVAFCRYFDNPSCKRYFVQDVNGTVWCVTWDCRSGWSMRAAYVSLHDFIIALWHSRRSGMYFGGSCG